MRQGALDRYHGHGNCYSKGDNSDNHLVFTTIVSITTIATIITILKFGNKKHSDYYCFVLIEIIVIAT